MRKLRQVTSLLILADHHHMTAPLHHVGLYIGDNNIVHASTPQDGVKISSLDTSYYMDNYFAARRIL